MMHTSSKKIMVYTKMSLIVKIPNSQKADHETPGLDQNGLGAAHRSAPLAKLSI
jgi:hypothetical protein